MLEIAQGVKFWGLNSKPQDNIVTNQRHTHTKKNKTENLRTSDRMSASKTHKASCIKIINNHCTNQHMWRQDYRFSFEVHVGKKNRAATWLLRHFYGTNCLLDSQ